MSFRKVLNAFVHALGHTEFDPHFAAFLILYEGSPKVNEMFLAMVHHYLELRDIHAQAD